jgi:hypothetical protein
VSQRLILTGERLDCRRTSGDGKRFIVHADEKLSAFVELERQVLTMTFYLESIRADPTNDGN